MHKPAFLLRIASAGLLALAGVAAHLPAPARAADGVYTSTLVISPAEDGRLEQPGALAVDPQGNVVVADAGMGRVQRRTPGGALQASFATFTSQNITLRFGQVAGVAVAADGTTYVADAAAKAVYVFNAAGTLTRIVGREGAGDGQFLRPAGLAVDSARNLYVVDADGNSVQKFSPEGVFQRKIGTRGVGNAQFRSPSAAAVDGSGNLYVVDQANDRVQKFDSNGQFVWAVGGSGSASGQFANPTGIAVDGSGRLLVMDTNNSRVQVLGSDGATVASWPAPGAWIAYSATGGVYISNPSTGRVTRYSDTGATTGAWGQPGSGSGQLRSPMGVALFANGDLAVADTNNHRVQVFDATGRPGVVFGTRGTGDGQFDSPQGVATDADGNIYVADTGNNRVQKFDRTGKFLLKAGTSGAGDGQLFRPGAVAAVNRSIYVADTGNARIQRFDSNGVYLNQWGTKGSGPSQFTSPTGLAVDSGGNAYVADAGNGTIQRFSSDGTLLLRLTAGDLGGGTPYGVAIDRAANIYFSERTPASSAAATAARERVIKLDATGKQANVLGGAGTVQGSLNGPAGLAVTDTQDVLVADTLNQRVQRFGFTAAAATPAPTPVAPTAPSGPFTPPDSGGTPVFPQPSTPPVAGSTPGNLTPFDGTQLTTLGTVVRWTNPAGATQFHLQVVPKDGDGPGVDLIVGDPAQVAGQAFNLPAPALGQGPYVMLPDMTYYWRIRTTTSGASLGADSPDWGPWTAPITFHTPVRTAAALRPTGPADGARLGGNTTTLAWTGAPADVFYYEVQLSKDPAFTTTAGRAFTSVFHVLVHGGVSTPVNSWATPALEPRSFYYWRVRPRVQGDGTPVAWSSTFTFETP